MKSGLSLEPLPAFEEKRQVLPEVIDRVVIDGDQVSIYGIIPQIEEDSNNEDLVSVASQSCWRLIRNRQKVAARWMVESEIMRGRRR